MHSVYELLMLNVVIFILKRKIINFNVKYKLLLYNYKVYNMYCNFVKCSTTTSNSNFKLFLILFS